MRRLVVLLLAAGIACTSSPGPDPAVRCPVRSTVSAGQKLPNCSFPLLEGPEMLRLASLRGKPSVINFWATWCVACKKEMPAIEQVHQELGDRVTIVGMDLLGVQLESAEAARDYARARGVTYTMAFDEGAYLYGHFGNRLRPVMPLTAFIGPDLRMRQIHFGELTAARLRALISEHLGVE